MLCVGSHKFIVSPHKCTQGKDCGFNGPLLQPDSVLIADQTLFMKLKETFAWLKNALMLIKCKVTCNITIHQTRAPKSYVFSRERRISTGGKFRLIHRMFVLQSRGEPGMLQA